MRAKGLILDMDGSLYGFDKGTCLTFEESGLYREICRNVEDFFVRRFALSPEDAAEMYQDMKLRFSGEVSLGLERERNIPRSEYFAATWDMDPSKFIEANDALVTALGSAGTKLALLSAAPQVWVNKVIDFLGVRGFFEPNIFTGEPDIRKPNPEAFLQVAAAWDIDPAELVSIGDQELTDILPAKQVGMRTVRIGRDQDSSADFVANDMVSALDILRKRGIL